MSLFKLIWLRKMIRRYTSPIPEERAELMKKRLSFIYAFIAWNAFGFVCYQIYTGKASWATYHGYDMPKGTPAQQWAKTLGIQDATVYRVSGFKVQKYEIHDKVQSEDNNNNNNNSNSTEQLST